MWFNIINTIKRQLAIVRWIVKQVDQQQIELLCNSLTISPFLARLLINRGFKEPQQVFEFLNPNIAHLHDPFLLKDMDRAVLLLLKAKSEDLPVLVYGDYDVDGITGVAVLKEFLERFGWRTEYYIPKRMDEGYGIQPSVIDQFCRKSKGIIVTVDCGITAFEAIDFANSLGCPVIVTDHHEVGEELPRAAAIIDPKRPDDPYPFKDLAGVSVAFKLICALAQELGIEREQFFDLLELVALGTVADMVKLVDENRFIVKEGLRRLRNTKRPGLSLLFARLGIVEPDSRDIGYRVAPKLNAAGRLDSADDAFQLLIAQDITVAERLVDLLFEYNTARQEIEADIFAHAVEQIEEYELQKDPLIVVRGSGWHVGVIGIVATRLVHRYGRPVMVISESEDIARGSARSVPEINLIELLQPLSSHFKEFGGHPLAVGFSLSSDSIDSFIEALRSCKIPVRETFDVIEVDHEIQLEQINDQMLLDMQMLEPFGHGNPEPIFLSKNISAEFLRTFGQSHSNVKMGFVINGRKIEALGFGLGYLLEKPSYESTNLDIVFSIRNGRGSLSLNVIDLSLPKKSCQSTEENEIAQRWLHFDRLFSELKPGRFFILDLRTRNAFLLWLKEKVDLKCAVISINNIVSSHVHQSLLRHVQGKLSYANSLNRNSLERFTFMTVSYFLDEKDRIMSQYDLFVVNELAHFKVFQQNRQISEFLQLVRENIDKFVALSVKNPDDLLNFATTVGFETAYEKSLKPNYGLTDLSGDIDSVINDASCFLFSDQRKLAEFFKRFKDRWKGKEVIIYSHTLRPGQRLNVVNCLKKKKFGKLISSTNTDGLPTMLGQEAEIAIIDAPFTLFEILDVLSTDGDNQLLDLCFTSESVKEREADLEELFPSEKILDEILTKIRGERINQRDLNEVLVESGYLKTQSYAKIIMSILRDLGATFVGEEIILSHLRFSRKPVRIMERELEFAYFEGITKPLLTQRVKGIYRALANVKTVI